MAWWTSVSHIRGICTVDADAIFIHQLSWPERGNVSAFNGRLCAVCKWMRESVDPHLNKKGISATGVSVISVFFFSWRAPVEWRVKPVAYSGPTDKRNKNCDLCKNPNTNHRPSDLPSQKPCTQREPANWTQLLPSSPPFVIIHSNSNPESKSPYAWTNLINTHHLLTHPALSFSYVIRLLLCERWLDNVPWPWTRHRTLRGLCFCLLPFSHLWISHTFMRVERQAINHQVIGYASVTQDAHHAFWLESGQTLEDWFCWIFNNCLLNACQSFSSDTPSPHQKTLNTPGHIRRYKSKCLLIQIAQW